MGNINGAVAVDIEGVEVDRRDAYTVYVTWCFHWGTAGWVGGKFLAEDCYGIPVTSTVVLTYRGRCRDGNEYDASIVSASVPGFVDDAVTQAAIDAHDILASRRAS